MLTKEEVLAARENGLSVSAIAAQYGVNKRTVWKKLAALKKGAPAEFTHTPVPTTEIPVTDLIAHRKKQFDQLRIGKEARRLIPVKVNLHGPIGILTFGDPHLDDDGTDLGLVEEHVRLIGATEGLFGANIGDTTNNWMGRLARLYAEQSTSTKQAWQIAEWFIRAVDWLYFLSGNHDAWSGPGDPIKWILNSGVPNESGVRLNLQFPNKKEVRINARHTFPGHSMWNTTHGPSKAAQMGWRDHILIAGHTHVSGYQILKDPMTGMLSHAIRVGSYKTYDRYAEQLGLPDQCISPAVVTVIDPAARTETGLITVFHDVEEGAAFLTWKRQRKAA